MTLRGEETAAMDVVAYDIKTGIYSFLAVVIVGISLVPPFELWIFLAPPTVFAAVPVLALALFLQTALWLILYWLFQKVALGRNRHIDPSQTALYATMRTFAGPCRSGHSWWSVGGLLSILLSYL